MNRTYFETIPRKTWQLRVTGSCTLMNRKTRRVNALVDGLGDGKGAVLRYMLARRNAWQWYGCEVTAVTPLGQTFYVLVEPQA